MEKLSEKYKFSELLKEMEEAGEIVDTEQWIIEVKALETERDQFKEAFKKQALYSGELEARIAEAEKLTQKLKEYVEWDRPQVTHSFYASQLRGVINELESALRGEAEG